MISSKQSDSKVRERRVMRDGVSVVIYQDGLLVTVSDKDTPSRNQPSSPKDAQSAHPGYQSHHRAGRSSRQGSYELYSPQPCARSLGQNGFPGTYLNSPGNQSQSPHQFQTYHYSPNFEPYYGFWESGGPHMLVPSFQEVVYHPGAPYNAPGNFPGSAGDKDDWKPFQHNHGPAYVSQSMTASMSPQYLSPPFHTFSFNEQNTGLVGSVATTASARHSVVSSVASSPSRRYGKLRKLKNTYRTEEAWRLIIFNLPADTDNNRLWEFVRHFHGALQVRVVFRNKVDLFAFLTFETKETAEEALKALDGQNFNGKVLRAEKSSNWPKSEMKNLRVRAKKKDLQPHTKRNTPGFAGNLRQVASKDEYDSGDQKSVNSLDTSTTVLPLDTNA